jgi:OmpA-OmpF porin, OOP family
MNHFSNTAIFLLLFSSFSAVSQNSKVENLVPNPSFEEYSDTPSGWYYSGKDFSRVSLYWTSPTAASPDIYGPKVIVPDSWKAAGFGKVHSYSGVSHAGITVYGCGKGKPHCREYIQVQLDEPLVPGQLYGFSCMLAHLQKSVIVKNLGLWFSDDEIDVMTTDPLLEKPVLTLDRFLPSDGNWYRWSGKFKADQSLSYLLIGNFSTDDDSQVKIPARSDLRFGYYYVDDVRLFKIPPILTPPVPESPFKNFVPKPGEVVTLDNIYFEHDRSDFMPRALLQLKDLLDFLKKYPTLQIEVIGHTDNVGTPEYNQQLSIRRAAAVVNWLKSKGIKASRMKSSGVGATQPVSSNYSSIGRSFNRRVEIKVISL